MIVGVKRIKIYEVDFGIKSFNVPKKTDICMNVIMVRVLVFGTKGPGIKFFSMIQKYFFLKLNSFFSF